VLKQVALPREVYTGSCTQLFDFLAQTLAEFIREQQQVRTAHLEIEQLCTASTNTACHAVLQTQAAVTPRCPPMYQPTCHCQQRTA
jgi:hypothetical protein